MEVSPYDRSSYGMPYYLLLLQIVQGDFGEIDVYHNSRLYTSAELNGTVRSGLLVMDGEIAWVNTSQAVATARSTPFSPR